MRSGRYAFHFAEAQVEVSRAQALRYEGFCEENGIPCAFDPLVRLDVSAFDTLPTTHHALVEDSQTLVATARLAVANAAVRMRTGAPLGVELEREFVVPEFESIWHQAAEIGRVCVLKRWHGTEAVTRLYEALYSRSIELGVRYWFGGVDLQTDDEGDALLEYRVLRERRLVSEQFHARALPQPSHAREAPRCSFYSDDERRAGASGAVAELRVASTVTAFVRRLGAQCLGPPALHPAFPRWVVPMIVDLEALPTTTLAKFDRSSIAPAPPSSSRNTLFYSSTALTTRRLAS